MVKLLMGIPCYIILWLISSLFTTFVLQNLWNWFAIPALHASEISFWVMYGLRIGETKALFRNRQPHPWVPGKLPASDKRPLC